MKHKTGGAKVNKEDCFLKVNTLAFILASRFSFRYFSVPVSVLASISFYLVSSRPLLVLVLVAQRMHLFEISSQT